jgi:hypothetical protein
MYCSECGVNAAGKFCVDCGARLRPPGKLRESEDLPLETVEDWSQLVDYKRLIAISEVRDLIAASASRSKKGISGEQWLELYGKVLGNTTGVPLPLSGIAHFAQSLHARLGIRTGKSRSEYFALPAGRMLVTLLCSLARHGREVRSARQQTDGVILVSALPSDLCALEGDLVVHLARTSSGTLVEASTDIPGQLFDWGKSTRALDGLFAELRRAA